MINSLFPITELWSWSSFTLYMVVAYLVVFLCKCGSRFNRSSISSKNGLNRYYIFAIIILTLLATVRSYEVGSDTFVYVNEFKNFRIFKYEWSSFFSFYQDEPGYLLLLQIVRSITSNYRVLFFVIYAPLAYAYIKFISVCYDDNDSYTFLPLMIFYFFHNMSGMRSALGTIFLLHSFLEMRTKKYGKALVLTLIACMFHYTMIYNFYVIVVSWIFESRKFRKKKWLWVVGILGCIVFVNVGLSSLLSILSETKYGYYTNIGTASFAGSIPFVIFGVLALAYYRRISTHDTKYMSALIISLALLVAYPIIFVTVAYRIPYYYIMPRLVIWDYVTTQVLKKFTKSSAHLVKACLNIVVFVYLLFMFTNISISTGFIYTI